MFEGFEVLALVIELDLAEGELHLVVILGQIPPYGGARKTFDQRMVFRTFGIYRVQRRTKRQDEQKRRSEFHRANIRAHLRRAKRNPPGKDPCDAKVQGDRTTDRHRLATSSGLFSRRGSPQETSSRPSCQPVGTSNARGDCRPARQPTSSLPEVTVGDQGDELM